MTESELMTIDSPLAVMPVMGIEQAVARRNAIVNLTKSIMVEDVDFGTIPGTDKPTLYKPGAEKLTTFFGLSPRFQIVKETEDWGNGGREPFLYYWYKCQLWRGSLLVGEGEGSCNSHESKYRWRWVDEADLPPGVDPTTLKTRGGRVSEFAFAIDKAETTGKYGKPEAYWQRFKDAIQGGTARKFRKQTAKGAEYDAWEIDSTQYRIPNDEVASLANTILKMAQKRALIAATLIAVNASEFFTQDLEDLVIEGEYENVTLKPRPPDATDDQKNAIHAKLTALGAKNVDKALELKGYPPLAQLNEDQATELLDRLGKAVATEKAPDADDGHWLKDERQQKRYFACLADLSVPPEQAKEWLGVTSMYDYAESLDSALRDVLANKAEQQGMLTVAVALQELQNHYPDRLPSPIVEAWEYLTDIPF